MPANLSQFRSGFTETLSFVQRWSQGAESYPSPATLPMTLGKPLPPSGPRFPKGIDHIFFNITFHFNIVIIFYSTLCPID